MNLTVSVLIPTRNRANALEQCLLHVFGQRLEGLFDTRSPQWEVIVIDNGSTDETPAVLRRIGEIGPLRILHEPIPGKSRAVNRALSIASGELLVFIDDDVHPSLEWLPSLIQASRKFSDAAVFCGPIFREFPAGAPAWLRDHQAFVSLAFALFDPKCRRESCRLQMCRMVRISPSDRRLCKAKGSALISALLKKATSCVKIPSSSVGSGPDPRSSSLCRPPPVAHCIRPSLMDPAQLWERAFS